MSAPANMPAIVLDTFGGPGVLKLGEWPRPKPSAHDVLVRVAASALNRADILQREGKYPPPPGESPLLGLEMAGTVAACGEAVTQWKAGDRVCGLLAGGGYAAYAVIHQSMALPIPEGMSWEEAAAIPEVFLTAFQALRWLAHLEEDEWVLIHAGASGVGTAAIQLVREMGGHCIVTASAAKHELCLRLGAERAIDYRGEDFAAAVAEYTGGRGVDVVVDFIGASNFQRNLEVLRLDGRLVMLALMGGARPGDVNLGPILRKRLRITGSTLRNRSLDYKIELTQAFREFAWPRFRRGALRPVVDRVFPWTDAADAHRYMEENRNQGKIVLKM